MNLASTSSVTLGASGFLARAEFRTVADERGSGCHHQRHPPWSTVTCAPKPELKGGRSDESASFKFRVANYAGSPAHAGCRGYRVEVCVRQRAFLHGQFPRMPSAFALRSPMPRESIKRS